MSHHRAHTFQNQILERQILKFDPFQIYSEVMCDSFVCGSIVILFRFAKKALLNVRTPKPLSPWEVRSGDLELTRCKSTVKAIRVGLANSANYPDQWSNATFIRCKLYCERGSFFLSLLGGAAYAAVSRDFWSVLHLRFYQRVYGCQSSMLSNSRVYILTSFIFQVSYSYFRICDNDEPGK